MQQNRLPPAARWLDEGQRALLTMITVLTVAFGWTAPATAGTPETCCVMRETRSARSFDPNGYYFAATRFRPNADAAVPAAGQEYGIVELQFGTPGYVTWDPRFYLSGSVSPDRGAQPERDLRNGWTVEGIALKPASGGTWGMVAGPFEVPAGTGALSPAAGGTPLRLAADTLYRVRIAFHVAPGGELPAGLSLMTQAQTGQAGEVQRLGATSQAGHLLDARLTGGNQLIGGHALGPHFMVAKGGDGRPVFLVTGDSIGAGVGDAFNIDPRGNVGIFDKALDDARSSKRLAFSNDSIPGSRPAFKLDRSTWRRKLDSYRLAGNLPFTDVLAEDGVNSLGPPAALSATLKAYYRFLRSEWPHVRLYSSQMLPHTTASTDKVSSLTGQNQGLQERYPDGGLWVANAKADADLFDGLLDGTVRTWQRVVAGTGSDALHQQLAVPPFSAAGATLAAADPARSKTLLLRSPAPPDVSDTLVLDPENRPGLPPAMAMGGPVATPPIRTADGLWAVTLFNGAAVDFPAGTPVRASWSPDGVHMGPGLVARAVPTVIAFKALLGSARPAHHGAASTDPQ